MFFGFFFGFFAKMLKFVVLALFVAVALAGWDISYVNGDGVSYSFIKA